MKDLFYKAASLALFLAGLAVVIACAISMFGALIAACIVTEILLP